MRFLSVLVLSVLIPLSGCAATKQLSKSSQGQLMASAENRPGWLDSQVFEREGFLFFVGTVDSVQDLSVGVELAEAQAKSVIQSEIRADIRREFSKTLAHADRHIAQSFEDALTSSTSDVKLRGLMHVNRYWERFAASSYSNAAYSYRMFLQVRVSKVEVMRIRALAMQDLTQRVQADTSVSRVLLQSERSL